MNSGKFRLLSLTLAGVLSIGAAPVPTGDIAVTVTGLRSEKGQVFACLAAEDDPFPKCHGHAARKLVLPTPEAHSFLFEDVPTGRYAIALLHDENANSKMDKMMMIPREGFGFSRDAKVVMGPPPFARAAFVLGDKGSRQSIQMRYLM